MSAACACGNFLSPPEALLELMGQLTIVVKALDAYLANSYGPVQSQLATSVKRHSDLIPYLARGSLGTRARARAVDARSTFLITDIIK